jgi:hypothetical protein
MSGTIFIRRLPQPNSEGHHLIGEYFNGAYLSAFGLMLDAALSQFPGLLEIIKEREVLRQYNFDELNVADFNTVVKAIREHIENWQKPEKWQEMAQEVWQTLEPHVLTDTRYLPQK